MLVTFHMLILLRVSFSCLIRSDMSYVRVFSEYLWFRHLNPILSIICSSLWDIALDESILIIIPNEYISLYTHIRLFSRTSGSLYGSVYSYHRFPLVFTVSRSIIKKVAVLNIYSKSTPISLIAESTTILSSVRSPWTLPKLQRYDKPLYIYFNTLIIL